MRQITQIINHHLLSLFGLPIVHGLLVWAYLLDVISINVFWAALHVTFLMIIQIALDIRAGIKALKNTELLELGIDEYDYPLSFADNSHKIIFKNHALEALEKDERLAQYGDLVLLLTQGLFRFSKLSFVENQVKAKKLLKSLTDTFESLITLNNKGYRVVLTPIVNEQGERLGTLMEWQIRSPLGQVETDMKHLRSYFETIKLKQSKDNIAIISRKPKEIYTSDATWIVEKVEQFNHIFSDVIANMFQKGVLNRRAAEDTKYNVIAPLASGVKPEQQLQSVLKQFKILQLKLNQGLAQINEAGRHRSDKQLSSLANLKETVYQAMISLNQNVNQLEHLLKSLQRARRSTDKFDAVILNAKTQPEPASEHYGT
ncbi:MAG: hypothetical protein U1E78_08935 [Gammaproteobacteria bacterium]